MDAAGSQLRVERDERGVVTLLLDRPDARNALSAAMMNGLTRAARDLASDASARVVVLRGAGDTFCAGGDLAWMREQAKVTPETRRSEARRLASMLGALHALPQAVIGRVQGGAFGGGVGLMSVCDVCLGADDARFGLTETRLGLIAATIGPYVAARIGQAAAKRHMLSGALFDARQAVRIDLLAHAVPAAELDGAVEREVAAHLKAAPGAVAATKRMLRSLGPPIDEAVVERTLDALVERWESEEAAEGIDAFFSKRRPGWSVG